MIKTTNIKSTLSIKYHHGQDEKGREVYKLQKLNNVNTNALDEDIFGVASALGKLLEDSNIQVFRQNNLSLGEE